MGTGKCTARVLCCLLVGWVLVCGQAGAGEGLPWPKASPEAAGMRSSALADMLREVRDKGAPIDSITVVRKGLLVLDAYRYPYRPDARHVLHSCTKSIVSALVGVALDRGLIPDLESTVLGFFPGAFIGNLDERKRRMTLRHLLTMTAGLECRDSHVHGWEGMAELMKSRDWVTHILSLPMHEAPGERFEYCNGASYLLSAILTKVTGMRTRDFAREALFGPLGITDVGWRSGRDGIDVGWGEMRMRPHDLARIGCLYLQKGRWGRRRVLSEHWVTESTKGWVDGTLFDRYGYQWWVDDGGIYMAVGYKGQYLFVVPEKELVAVFMSSLPREDFYLPDTLLRRYLLRGALTPSPLPADTTARDRLRLLEAAWARLPREGFTWFSKAEGWAREGDFVRKAAPAFRFQYPPAARKRELKLPGQIASLQTPGNDRLDVFVIQRPQAVSLEEFARKFLVPRFEMGGSEVRLRANREIRLSCGTRAFRSRIDWMWKDRFLLTTDLVTAYRRDRCIYLAVHSTLGSGHAARFLETLRLEGG